MNTQKTVLLFEDMPCFYEPIGRAMSKRYRRVIRLVGLLKVRGDKLVGIKPRAHIRNKLNSDTWDGDKTRLVEISLSEVAMVFLDRGLSGKLDAATQILPVLLKAHIPVVAIAGTPAGNNELRQLGAIMALNKVFVVAALETGLIDPIIATRSPVWVAALLRVFEEEKQQDLVALRTRVREAA
jgi:hypothetical protein